MATPIFDYDAMAFGTTGDALDNPDAFYNGPSRIYAQCFIAIRRKQGDVIYWLTNGAISPEDVARVMVRYYATQERVDELTDELNGGASRIHPLTSSAWVTATIFPAHRDWPYAARNIVRMVFWTREGWTIPRARGLPGFLPITPDNYTRVQET